MRVAEPDEVKTRAYPVLSAAISEAELVRWFPVWFHHITDTLAEPEPTKAAFLQLDGGPYFIVRYGEISNELKLDLPTSTDTAAFIEAFFREVPMPLDRVIWHRQDVRLPHEIAAAGAALPEEARTRYPR